MRWLPPILLLTACSPDAETEQKRSLYAGAGRDRLCIDGNRAGFIAFGEGDANCSARGIVERANGPLTIIPSGDRDCRIPVELADGSIQLGSLTPACSYYCGPGADFSGKSFTENAGASPAVDFAGDPLC